MKKKLYCVLVNQICPHLYLAQSLNEELARFNRLLEDADIHIDRTYPFTIHPFSFLREKDTIHTDFVNRRYEVAHQNKKKYETALKALKEKHPDVDEGMDYFYKDLDGFYKKQNNELELYYGAFTTYEWLHKPQLLIEVEVFNALNMNLPLYCSFMQLGADLEGLDRVALAHAISMKEATSELMEDARETICRNTYGDVLASANATLAQISKMSLHAQKEMERLNKIATRNRIAKSYARGE